MDTACDITDEETWQVEQLVTAWADRAGAGPPLHSWTQRHDYIRNELLPAFNAIRYLD